MSTAYIKNLIDYNGDIIYPQTKASAVYDDDGNLLSNIIAYKPTVVTGTLSAGSTSITLNNDNITTNSVIDIYTNVYGINPTAVSATEGNITLTFDSQSSDINVRVEVK